jgi:hypothetical protein
MEVYMKKWLNGIAVVLLCLAAAAVCFHFIGKARLARKIAGLKAQGLPTSFAELEAYSKLPEGTANAADIYMKAFAAYKPLADEEKQKILPVMSKEPDPNDNEPYPPERMAAAAEFIELNKEMFALLHEGGKIEDCYYPMDYSQGPLPKNDLLQNIKRACQSLKIAVIYYSQTHQPQKAYEAIVDQLRLGQSMSSGPYLISHLVRTALFAIGVSGIEEIINRTSLDKTQLQQLQEHLQQIEQTTKFGPGLRGEICFCLEYKDLQRKIVGYALAADRKGTQYVMALIPKNTTMLIDAYQQIIEVDKLPIQEQLPKVREIIKEATDTGFLIPLPRIMLPAIEKVFEIHLRIRANMDCAITALAVERYRLKEGKLPETVEALAPGYLAEVYMDPFDGKPLRYKKAEPGYMIYTIGPDGVDNGGQGWDKTTKTQDWAFRVYR